MDKMERDKLPKSVKVYCRECGDEFYAYPVFYDRRGYFKDENGDLTSVLLMRRRELEGKFGEVEHTINGMVYRTEQFESIEKLLNEEVFFHKAEIMEIINNFYKDNEL